MKCSGKNGAGPSARQSLALTKNRGNESVEPFKMSTLVYPFVFSSSSATGGVWSWQFRLNSLFDPDFTGTGAQPTGFDQWMALYDRYRVLATEIDWNLTAATAAAQVVATGAPGVDAAPTLTYVGVAGDRAAKLAKPVPCGSLSSASAKHSILMKDVFGINQEALLSEINYSGTSSSSAPAVAYYNIAANVQNDVAVVLSGQIRFAVRFENPHDNNVSLSRVVPRAGAPAVKTLGTAQNPAEFDDKTEQEIRAYLARLRAGEPATPPRLSGTASTLGAVSRK